MKPLEEKGYTQQALKNGKGITWLDDCRIPYADDSDMEEYDKCCSVNGKYETGLTWGGKRVFERVGNTEGRFPANLLVENNILDTGKITETKPHSGDGERLDTQHNGWGFKRMAFGGADKGSYSRYFSLDSWWQKVFPFIITPKPAKSEKELGLSNKRNSHPTIKSMKLMSYLITMISRQGDVVLDPYMGSGTTGIACMGLGREFVGIEMSEEYYKIAEERLSNIGGEL